MGRPNADGAPIRVVFYNRVGSGYSRDQDAAVLRQAERIREISERLNLKVVGIFTDFAVTRSTPWPARPAARKLTQRLTERAILADMVIVDDPQHSIGPDNISAALKAIPIPLCTPREALHPVTAEDPINAIAGRIHAPQLSTPRGRRFPLSYRRR